MEAIFYVAYTIFGFVVIGAVSILRAMVQCCERAVLGDYTAI
jgi:hypothetical protein